MSGGLSHEIHNSDKGSEFEIKGPLGKGLTYSKTGVHVAFTAGTGILVYLDLVAHLIRKKLGLLSEKEAKMLSEDFKLVFFISF
jgi:hypothetical protein